MHIRTNKTGPNFLQLLRKRKRFGREEGILSVILSTRKKERKRPPYG